MLIGWETTFHPFRDRPTYQKLAGLPLAERIVELRRPEVRRAILAEEPPPGDPARTFATFGPERIFPIGDPPDYEPGLEQSVLAIANREGRSAEAVLYDLMCLDGGRELLMVTIYGYSYGDLDAIREMILHPNAALGLSDGGAHVGLICDSSLPTFMITHWARDRQRGEKLALELVVRTMTSDTADLFGLGDRGIVEPGWRGDLNVIDFGRLQLKRPEVRYDLPTGARRLVQSADGYLATIVAGEVIMDHGEDTGARPGKVLRGAR